MYENPEIAFGGTRPMLGLIETIYAAVQQPELWETVMDGISEAIGGQQMSLWLRLPEQELISMSRFDPREWQQYVNYYASVNSLMAVCDAMFADGAVRYSHMALPDREFERTEFCNDYFKPNDMHYSIGLKIPMGDLPAAYLSCQRPKRRGAFSEREGLVYETLQPHLKRALSLHGQMQAMSARALGLETTLEAHEHAVVGVAADGRVALSNPAAEAILRAGDGLWLVHGRLRCKLPPEDKQLRALLADPRGGGAMAVSRRTPNRPLHLTVSRFDAPMVGQGTRLAALVFVSDPSAAPRSRAATLVALYGLTPTEARVADLLAQGMDAARVAEHLRITLETARFHVKRILAKTGARRQPELVRLMLSLPGL